MNIYLIEQNLNNISFLLLLIALIISWSNLLVINTKLIQKITQILTLITTLCLSGTLITRWIINHYFPLSNLYESLIFLAWSILFIGMIIEFKSKSRIVSAITIPTALLIIAFTSLSIPSSMKVASPLVPALRSNWLMMHVTMMMISYSILIIGSLLSVLFLVISYGKDIKIKGNSNNHNSSILLEYKANYSQDILIKKDTNKFLYKFKQINLLESIDNLSYRIIGLGFPFLTIGIISGAVWANEAWGTYWSWDPKETWALITWIIFAIYLHSRLNQSWQGKKPALLASLGFIIVWICYLGVNFLGKGLHSYGWLS
uniref:Cytochrome c biogenesis protein CcsA n=1 Tax=Taenioma perpusillum TaxID=210852 RepID=A0A1Z1MRK6_9FLOR|nr:cytochrome c biogenesis protein ccs1 [Taenioma perpusillum]ARW68462.1 cytochrome c biogenesis protein ccs1 [Taenioma perpusillum]